MQSLIAIFSRSLGCCPKRMREALLAASALVALAVPARAETSTLICDTNLTTR